MNITFAPEGILQIDDARLVFRNFSGTRGKYCKEGEGDFAVVIRRQRRSLFTEDGMLLLVLRARKAKNRSDSLR